VLTDPPGESIRVARMPLISDPDAATHSRDLAVEVEPYPAPMGDGEPLPAPAPPSLRFVTEQPRTTRLDLRTSLRLIAAMIPALVLVIVIAASSGGGGHRPHKSAVRLTPAQQHAVAAERARAAAIAKARRDRGTDAELQDTVPAATPLPSQ
jgi:hypothetical protein